MRASSLNFLTENFLRSQEIKKSLVSWIAKADPFLHIEN